VKLSLGRIELEKSGMSFIKDASDLPPSIMKIDAYSYTFQAGSSKRARRSTGRMISGIDKNRGVFMIAQGDRRSPTMDEMIALRRKIISDRSVVMAVLLHWEDEGEPNTLYAWQLAVRDDSVIVDAREKAIGVEKL
jgi:hypothetical protein